MLNALGSVESVLVLGGKSDIGVATLERLASERCRRAVLAVRDPSTIDAETQRLRAAGFEAVESVAFDAADRSRHPAVIAEAAELIGDIDLVLIAYGVLGDQSEYDEDPVLAGDDAATNYAGTVSIGMAAANHLRSQGHGTIVLLSSVAGVRTRKTNYVYGSAKAGADAFALGLGDALAGTGARVMVVRPGFVRSRMTEGMDPQPFATTPEAVADAIANGLRRHKTIVWVPGVLKVLMTVMRHLPRPIWRIVSAR